MNDKELQVQLKAHIEESDSSPKQVQELLLTYKTSGGQQTNAQKIVEQLATDYSYNEEMQNSAYEILDIVTSWCIPEKRVWDNKITAPITDGLILEDEETGVLFNHYSFCEIIKHTMVKYGPVSYDTAQEQIANSYLSQKPRKIADVEFITHEVEFHWAMLLVHGPMYWTKGIPSDTNGFDEEHTRWRKELMQQYHLKEPYIYYEKQR